MSVEGLQSNGVQHFIVEHNSTYFQIPHVLIVIVVSKDEGNKLLHQRRKERDRSINQSGWS
jgi:hypothetical protein